MTDIEVHDDIAAILPEGPSFTLPPEWIDLLLDKKRRESPSSIVSYLNCPVRWFLDYHSPMPRRYEVTKWLFIGKVVHRVLEVYYSDPPEFRDEDLLYDVLDRLWDALKAEDYDDGIVNDELLDDFHALQEEDDQPDKLRGFLFTRIAECVRNLLMFDEVPSAVRVVSNERWVRGRKNGFSINGKIDRVDSVGGDRIDIIDYKTGWPPSDEDLKKIDVLTTRFLPLGLYAWMMDQENARNDLAPDIRAVRLLYLHPGKSDSLQRVSLRITDDILDKVDDALDLLTREMEDVLSTGSITACPSDSVEEGQCSYCPVSDICPVWNGEDSLDRLEEELVDG